VVLPALHTGCDTGAMIRGTRQRRLALAAMAGLVAVSLAGCSNGASTAGPAVPAITSTQHLNVPGEAAPCTLAAAGSTPSSGGFATPQAAVAATTRAWGLTTTQWLAASTETFFLPRHREYANFATPDSKQQLHLSQLADHTWFVDYHLTCQGVAPTNALPTQAARAGCKFYETSQVASGGGSPSALVAITTSPHRLPATPTKGWALVTETHYLRSGLMKQTYASGLFTAVVRQLKDKTWQLELEQGCLQPGR